MNNEQSNLDSVLIRIQKLLNMASDTSSPEEAAIAASRATKLMSQYNVTMADVIANDIAESHKDILSEPISNAEYTTSRYPLWQQWLANSLSRQFNCHTRFEYCGGGKYKLHVFGYSSDVTVVKYLFSYLSEQLNRLADKFVKKYKDAGLAHQTVNKIKRQYLCGAENAVKEKVAELYKKEEEPQAYASDGRALVEIKQQAIEEKFGRFKYEDSDFEDTSVSRQGYADANDKIHINKVIDSEELDEVKLLETV